MPNTKRAWICLLTAIQIFLCSCGKQAAAPTDDISENLYTPAAYALASKPQLSMNIIFKQTKRIGENSYSLVCKQKAFITNPGTEQMKIHKDGSVQYGQYEVQIQEYYQNDTLYLSINNTHFMGCMDSETYHATLPPVQMLTPNLYKQVIRTEQENGILLNYSQAMAAESWAMPSNAVFLSGSCIAFFTKEGLLKSTQYNIHYLHESEEVKNSITVEYDYDPKITLYEPPIQDYLHVQDIRIPILLEHTYGLLLQTEHVTSNTSESIFSQANAIHYHRNTSLERNGDTGKINTQVTLIDPSRGGDSTVITQIELFENGQYSLSVDNGQAQTQKQITSTQFFEYFTKNLTSNILSSAYIHDCSSSENDGVIEIRIIPNEHLSNTVCENSCQSIYQNAAFLDQQADESSKDTISYLVRIDARTGLPLSCSLDFSAIHTIEQIDYLLSNVCQQTYRYP